MASRAEMNQKIVELSAQRDRLSTRRAHVYAGADALSREGRELGVEIEALNKQIDALQPIDNSVAWIPSETREGAHLTVVIDGEGFCTCEDARYRNPDGGCKHFNRAIGLGLHDSRASFKGGFDGPVTSDSARTADLTNLLAALSRPVTIN